MNEPVAYIFGYGSLVNPRDPLVSSYSTKTIYGFLEDYKRHWGIAIDNLLADRDHKYYVDKEGKRYTGYVAMLGLSKKIGSSCNGIALLADQNLLDDINQRETSIYYRSEDLREMFSEKLEYPLYTYLASSEGIKNYQKGKEENNLIAPKEYQNLVEKAFLERSPQAHQYYIKTTETCVAPAKDIFLWRLPGKAGI